MWRSASCRRRIASARRGSKAGVAAQMLAEMRETERDVARFVLRGEPGHRRGDRIRCVPLDEPQQREERALAEHRQQERRDGELGLVDQRLERRLSASRRKTQFGRA